jgi:GNAT superfamily N-acetyltransferase
MLRKRIEEVSLNSWPALQQMLFDGWILRFAEGYTKRANSVNPLYASSLEVNEKVDRCEMRYAERGLPSVFRLTPFSSPADLDRVLESRGYQRADPTSVLHLDMRDREIRQGQAAELRALKLDDWMRLFYQFSEAPADEHQTHREILEAIPSTRLLASLEDSGKPVACGLGVLEDHYFGLFDLVTDPEQRNKGFGTQLVFGLLRWAQNHGARYAYLQVMTLNQPAGHLYAKFGFAEAYQYWYRILSA